MFWYINITIIPYLSEKLNVYENKNSYFSFVKSTRKNESELTKFRIICIIYYH